VAGFAFSSAPDAFFAFRCGLCGVLGSEQGAGAERVTATEDEFRTLVDGHSSMVYSVVLRLLGDPGLAEEVAQDVFLELHAWMPRLENVDHVRHWLRRVATHRATDALRRRKVRPEGQSEEWEAKHDRPAENGGGDGSPMSVAMERMLLSLPVAQRTVLVLRYGEDLTPEEIAGTTGEPLATVKSHLQRGLQLLRRKGSVVLKEFVRG
jgi:RNA polymerase sigma-70 factor (ECF subfamily)